MTNTNEFKQIDEFFPTPPELAAKLLSKTNVSKMKYILDPSAGKGDLLKFLQIYTNSFEDRYSLKGIYEEINKEGISDEEFEALKLQKVSELALNRYHKYINEKYTSAFETHYLDIDCVEINQNLKYILEGKNYRVVDSDFLNFTTEKKYDLIIMNPPFSNGDLHLLKAISLQKRFGGQILCILNAETIRNPYSNARKELAKQLSELNAEVEYVKNAFSAAERPTNVEVALIRINVPEPAAVKSFILDQLEKEEITLETAPEYQALITTDYIRSAVIQYKTEIKAGKRLIEEFNAMRPLLASTFKKDGEELPMLQLYIAGETTSDYRYSSVDFNKYVERVRYKYWYELLHNADFLGNLTSNLKNEYYSKIQDLSHYDFSLSNIYRVKIDIVQQMVRGVEDKILELFEKFTYKHSTECDKNIHYFNGWNTNKAFMINKKVIVPWMRTWDDIWKKFSYKYELCEFLSDIEKTLAFLDTHKLDICHKAIPHWLEYYESQQQTKNMHFDYFDITVYKKGTVHITFTNEELLKKLNIYGCQRKGWLPPSYGKKHYEDMDSEEQSVVDEFEGKDSYEKIFAQRDEYLVANTQTLLLTD